MVLFVDENGKINMLMPTCDDPDCAKSFIYVYADDEVSYLMIHVV